MRVVVVKARIAEKCRKGARRRKDMCLCFSTAKLEAQVAVADVVAMSAFDLEGSFWTEDCNADWLPFHGLSIKNG